MDDFKIKLGVLTNGENSFSFEIKDQFFEAFAENEIKTATISVQAEVKKEIDSVHLSVTVSGTVHHLLCNLCAEEISIEINNNTSVLIKESEQPLESTDEIIYIAPNQHILAIDTLIYELIVLALPKRTVHPVDEFGGSTCNKEMINLIDQYKYTDNQEIDPRWDTLKDIKLK